MLRENPSGITGDYEPREPAALDCASRLLVSVIIPARDEANSISSLIREVKKTLSELPHEIVVVDDGSRDGTRKIALSNGALVVSHGKNLGKGSAMRSGVENAKGSIVVFLDADGAHNPQDIPRLIAPILEGKTDLVIGSRALPESNVCVSPLTRRLSNNFASFVISLIIENSTGYPPACWGEESGSP